MRDAHQGLKANSRGATVLRTLAVMLALHAATASAGRYEVIDVPTRPGITQRASIIAPESTRAVALLFAGGNGGVWFGADGTPASFRGNFLVRSHPLFVRQGLAVVIVGTPSDIGPPEYLTDAFRTSPEHATDMRALVAAVRQRFAAPVWLIGTSRGTLSAASVGLALGRAVDGGVDGVVLTAGMTAVADMAIDLFAVPALLVHHTQDTCRMTDTRDLRRVRSKLKAPRTELLTFSGGRSTGPACEAFAHHGFNGIEAEVVDAIVRWINLP